MTPKEKDIVKNYLLFFIFLTLMIYLSFAFILAELNPFNWNIFSRIITIAILFTFNFPFFINHKLK